MPDAPIRTDAQKRLLKKARQDPFVDTGDSRDPFSGVRERHPEGFVTGPPSRQPTTVPMTPQQRTRAAQFGQDASAAPLRGPEPRREQVRDPFAGNPEPRPVPMQAQPTPAPTSRSGDPFLFPELQTTKAARGEQREREQRRSAGLPVELTDADREALADFERLRDAPRNPLVPAAEREPRRFRDLSTDEVEEFLNSKRDPDNLVGALTSLVMGAGQVMQAVDEPAAALFLSTFMPGVKRRAAELRGEGVSTFNAALQAYNENVGPMTKMLTEFGVSPTWLVPVIGAPGGVLKLAKATTAPVRAAGRAAGAAFADVTDPLARRTFSDLPGFSPRGAMDDDLTEFRRMLDAEETGEPFSGAAQQATSRLDAARAQLDEMQQILSAREEAIAEIKPAPNLRGLSKEAQLSIAEAEGRNPFVEDWADSLDPVVIREYRQGFKQPQSVPTISTLRQQVRNLRREVSDLEGKPPETPQTAGAMQSGMGIGERPSQGTMLGEFRDDGGALPLVNREQAAARSARAAEVGQSQQAFGDMAPPPRTTAEAVEPQASTPPVQAPASAAGAPPSQPPARPPAPPTEPPSGGPPAVPSARSELLSDPDDFQTVMDVAFDPNRARRVGERLAQSPLGPLVRWANPTLARQTPVGRAAIGHAMIREEAAGRVSSAMAHPQQIGTQADLFGPTNRATGHLERGQLAGHSLNEIAENPSQFADRLTAEQQEWLRRMADIEDETLALYKRNGIDIGEIPPQEVERYAGRVVVGQVGPDGELIQAGFVGSQGRLGAKTSAEKARTFATVAEAEEHGFVYLPYEEAVRLKAQSAYKRVADKRAADWLLENLPEGVAIRPKTEGPLRFGETVSDLPALQGRIFTGENANDFRREIDNFFKMPNTNEFLRRVNQVNSVQRMFVLVGDASQYMIQLMASTFRHPKATFTSGARSARALQLALTNPAEARRFKANLYRDNADVLNEYDLILSGTGGLEGTEALARGGLAAPGTLLGKLGAVYRPFQLAYEVALDSATIEITKGLRHLGTTPTARRAIADYANHMSGVASSARLGLTPNARMVESALLLAPRYRRAIAALNTDLVQGGLRGDLARKAYASLGTGLMMSYAGITIGLGLIEGKSPDEIRDDLIDRLDPLSSRFLMFRIAGQDVGPGSKFISDFRMIMKVISGEALDFSDFQQNPGTRWVRGQLAGVPSTAWDVFTGRNFMYEPVDPHTLATDPRRLAEELGDWAVPIWMQSVAMEGGSVGERAARGAADFMGLRAFPQSAFFESNREFSKIEGMGDLGIELGYVAPTIDVVRGEGGVIELSEEQREQYQTILAATVIPAMTRVMERTTEMPDAQRHEVVLDVLGELRRVARDRAIAEIVVPMLREQQGQPPQRRGRLVRAEPQATSTPTPQRRGRLVRAGE